MQELFDWAFAAEEPAGQKSSAAGGAGFSFAEESQEFGCTGAWQANDPHDKRGFWFEPRPSWHARHAHVARHDADVSVVNCLGLRTLNLQKRAPVRLSKS